MYQANHHWNGKLTTQLGLFVCLCSTLASASELMYIGQGPGNGFDIVDVSTPASSGKLGSYNTAGGPSCIAVVGKRAYVCDSYQGVRILDVSNPTNPAPIGSVSGATLNNGMASDLAVQGDFLYVANGANGTRVFSISNPASPEFADHRADP